MANLYSGGTTGVGDYDVTQLADALATVYSLEVEYSSQPVMRYEDVAVRKEELLKTAGDTVRFTMYDDLTGGGELNEQDSLESEKIVASASTLTIKEYGGAVGISERLLRTSFDSQLKNAAILLGRNYARVRSLTIRNAMAAVLNEIFTTPSAGAYADIEETDRFDIETLRIGLEALRVANAPKFNDDFYVCYLHPHQSAYLRRDPDWVAAQHYGNQARGLFSGEIGRWEDCVFIETTLQQNGAVAVSNPAYDASLASAGKQNQHLYRATLVADQCVALADALYVEMRSGGVEDFGRKHRLAWYAMWGTKVMREDNLMHIITS